MLIFDKFHCEFFIFIEQWMLEKLNQFNLFSKKKSKNFKKKKHAKWFGIPLRHLHCVQGRQLTKPPQTGTRAHTHTHTQWNLCWIHDWFISLQQSILLHFCVNSSLFKNKKSYGFSTVTKRPRPNPSDHHQCLNLHTFHTNACTQHNRL